MSHLRFIMHTANHKDYVVFADIRRWAIYVSIYITKIYYVVGNGNTLKWG